MQTKTFGILQHLFFALLTPFDRKSWFLKNTSKASTDLIYLGILGSNGYKNAVERKMYVVNTFDTTTL